MLAEDSHPLDRKAEPDAYFADLPPALGAARSLTALKKEFEDYLYYNSSITLWYNPHLKLYSKLDETDKAFQRRRREAAKEALDAEAKKLKAKYERELERVEAKLRREERELEEDKIEYIIRQARRPVYFTTHKKPPVENAHFVPVGVTYHLLPETKTLDTDAPWKEIHYRNLDDTPSVLDLGADHILFDYHFFKALGDLLLTGPTNTNVMDIRIMLIP